MDLQCAIDDNEEVHNSPDSGETLSHGTGGSEASEAAGQPLATPVASSPRRTASPALGPQGESVSGELRDEEIRFGSAVLFDRTHILSSGHFSDLTITFNGEVTRVHKAILASVSPYFDGLLCGGQWLESEESAVAIDIAGAAQSNFTWLLRCVYGEKNLRLPIRDWDGVYRVADFFQMRQLTDTIEARLAKHVKTAEGLLRLCTSGPLHPRLLDFISETIQMDAEDFEALLRIAVAAGATGLEHRCGRLLAESVLRQQCSAAELSEYPFTTLMGCFSSDCMGVMLSEDDLLRLLRRTCEGSGDRFTQEQRLELAGCVRLQQLSLKGIEEAASWDAVGRNALIAALAKQRDPGVFPDFPQMRARHFIQSGFDPGRSCGEIVLEDHNTLAVHQSKLTRGKAVVGISCDLSQTLEITFRYEMDKSGDEGTCFGVAVKGERSPDYRVAQGPLWRSFNGEVRERGDVCLEVAKVHPGDDVGIRISGPKRTVSFLKGGSVVAVRSVLPDKLWPLSPAVWFYGAYVKVRIVRAPHSCNARNAA